MSEVEQEIEAEELAELEAQEVPEDGDEPEQGEDFEGVKTGPEQAAAGEAALIKQDKALTAEDKRHQTALGKAFGDGWREHVRCAMCDGIGFMGPEAARALSNEQWGQLLQVAAMLVTEDYVQDSNYQTCEHCAGKGQTRSGATNSDHYLKLCDVCQGNGFTQKQPQVPTYTIPTPLGNVNGAGELVQPSYGSPEANDQWGRPAGHVHYGIDPRYVPV